MRARTLARFGRVALKHRLTAARAPLNAMVALTDRCNARCSYCDIPARGRPGLKTEVLIRLIDELAAAGCARLGFWGGEPLLRADLGRLLDHARGRGLWTTMDTNGYLFPRRVRELGSLDHVVFSLDGRAEHHEQNREPGSFPKVMAALAAARDHRVPFWTLTVLTRHNLGDIDFLLDLAEQYGGRASFQLLHHPPGVASAEAAALLPEPEHTRRALQYLLDAKAAGRPVAVSRATLHHLLTWPDYHQTLDRDPRRPRCLAGRLWVNVDPDGGLSPCSLVGLGAGAPNAVQEGFDAAFARLDPPDCRACLATCFTEYQHLFRLHPGPIVDAVRALAPPRSPT